MTKTRFASLIQIMNFDVNKFELCDLTWLVSPFFIFCFTQSHHSALAVPIAQISSLKRTCDELNRSLSKVSRERDDALQQVEDLKKHAAKPTAAAGTSISCFVSRAAQMSPRV
jgi:hypothetical protein